MLNQPVRRMILNNRIAGLAKEQEDITSRFYANLGNALGYDIENVWIHHLEEAKELIGEKRIIEINPVKPTDNLDVYFSTVYRKEMDGYLIEGEIDCIWDGELIDHKLTSVYAYVNHLSLDDFVIQLNTYKWLIGESIKIDDIARLIYMYRAYPDFRNAKNPDYPDAVIHEKMIHLNMDMEAYIKAKIVDLEFYQDMDEPDLPPCPDDYLNRGSSTWKVYKKPDQKKATRVFDNQYDANSFLMDLPPTATLVEFKGGEGKCTYCPSKEICSQKG